VFELLSARCVHPETCRCSSPLARLTSRARPAHARADVPRVARAHPAALQKSREQRPDAQTLARSSSARVAAARPGWCSACHRHVRRAARADGVRSLALQAFEGDDASW